MEEKIDGKIYIVLESAVEIKSTDKAVYIAYNSDTSGKVHHCWLPKSVVRMVQLPHRSTPDAMAVAKWFYVKNQLYRSIL